MKIIHISDIHVGAGECADRWKLLASMIVSLKGPTQEEASRYVVVITGDLVDNAFRDDQYAPVEEGLEILRKAGFRVLVVPGNHDYGTGDRADRKFVKIFKERYFGDASIEYPKLDIIGDTAFIGLDSMAAELHWHDRIFAEGELGRAQRERLSEVLSSEAVTACRHRVVYLHHHPVEFIPFHQLKDAGALRHCLEALPERARPDVMLFGHNHAGHNLNGNWGIPRCYDAGTGTGKKREGLLKHFFPSRAATRVLDLDRDARFDYVLETF